METKEIFSVKVPYNKEIAYTLYSEGTFATEPKIDNNEDFITFFYLSKSVVVLFYTFEKFRRAYIATNYQKTFSAEKVFLPGVSSAMSIIADVRGKKLDNLKRAIYFFTNENCRDIFMFRPLFWSRLLSLCKRNARQSEYKYLYDSWKEKYGNR